VLWYGSGVASPSDKNGSRKQIKSNVIIIIGMDKWVNAQVSNNHIIGEYRIKTMTATMSVLLYMLR